MRRARSPKRWWISSGSANIPLILRVALLQSFLPAGTFMCCSLPDCAAHQRWEARAFVEKFMAQKITRISPCLVVILLAALLLFSGCRKARKGDAGQEGGMDTSTVSD